MTTRRTARTLRIVAVLCCAVCVFLTTRRAATVGAAQQTVDGDFDGIGALGAGGTTNLTPAGMMDTRGGRFTLAASDDPNDCLSKAQALTGPPYTQRPGRGHLGPQIRVHQPGLISTSDAANIDTLVVPGSLPLRRPRVDAQ